MFARWRPVTTAGPVRARLYVKDDCGLCEQARVLLRPFEQQGRLHLEAVDIGMDPELFRRYGLAIPVLELEWGVRLNWPFDARDLRRLLS